MSKANRRSGSSETQRAQRQRRGNIFLCDTFAFFAPLRWSFKNVQEVKFIFENYLKLPFSRFRSLFTSSYVLLVSLDQSAKGCSLCSKGMLTRALRRWDA